MPLPFKSKPKQTFVEIGDEAIGILHFPVKWGLTPNELQIVEEATKGNKGFRKIALELADKILSKWETDLERADVGNSVLRMIGVLSSDDEDDQAVDKQVLEQITDKHSKALETAMTKMADEGRNRKNAYIQAAMVYRFGCPEWKAEWGSEVEKCTEPGWSKPLAQSVYEQMLKEEQGDRYGKDEIVSEEEFKGFTPENIKKPSQSQQEETQKELTGAASSG